MIMRYRLCGVISAVLFVMTNAAAMAQTAPPTLQAVAPSGAQRGTRATLVLKGTNIDKPSDILFSEPGFSTKITAVREIPEKPGPRKPVGTEAPIEDKARKYEVTADVTIAADVPHGVHAFRLMTPLGVSNLLRFAVSSLPEVTERASTGPAAPTVALPAAIVGKLGKPGEVDEYGFDARAGEELVFQLVARPLGSRLDSVVRLLDRDRRVVAENNDFDLSRDSVLTWRVAEAGQYTLTVEDVEHGGGAEGFEYRVYAGALPYLASVFPLGVPAGAEGTIAAAGVNLGGAPNLRIAGDRAALIGRTIPVAVTAPAGHTLNRKPLALGSYPEAIESEPNDDPAAARALAIPSTVNGRIWTATGESGSRGAGGPVGHGVDGADPTRSGSRDRDVFRFHARKGQKLVFDVAAQQLDSPLDSVIEVLDAAGRVVPRAAIRCVSQTEIALNDPDSNRRSMRLATWNEIAPNDYLFIGDELLQVESMPTHPDADLILRGHRGMRTTLLDTSARNHSVGEAVYKVEIHPPGARLEPNGMPVFQIDYVNDDGGPRFGDRDSRLHFEAPADGDYFLRLSDVRGLEGERFAYRLTVREPAPDFALTFDPKSFNIPRGGRVSVTLTAERKDGFDEPIDVEVLDLPPGLTTTAGRIPADATTAVIMIAAAEDASLTARKAVLPSMHRAAARFDVPGVVALKVAGRATAGGRAVVRDAESLEPLPVVALAPPPDLVVTTDASSIELVPGEEVRLTVKVERRNGFAGRVPITVMNLPHGVRVDDIGLNGVMITEQETTRVVHIVAERWVQPQTQPLLVVGRVEVNSPLRNEAAAMPVTLVIKRRETTPSNGR
jgi:hypothetical protein